MSNLANKLLSWGTYNLEKIKYLIILAVIVFTFIPIRYIFPTTNSFILGEYSDFTSISLYLSQLLIIAYISVYFYQKWNLIGKFRLIKAVLGYLAILGVYLAFLDPNFIIISVFFYLKLSISLLFIYCLVHDDNLWLKYKDYLIYTIILLGILNILLGILQFTMQANIGLNQLGESPLSILGYGVAKIVAHETTFIRIYGLFPHPNILAGMLIVINLLNLYLLNKNLQLSLRAILNTTYFLSIIGLALTFSRGAIIAFSIATIMFIIIALYKYGIYRGINKFYIIPLSLVMAFLTFSPWYTNRTTVSDQAVDLRAIYNQQAIESIKKNWLLGTGPGTNVLHMKQDLGNSLPIWDIQPVHNFLLIVISELGIIGVAIVLFLIYLAIKLFEMIWIDIKDRETDTWRITLLAITVAIFVLMLFDHYFYTNWSAQTLLCLVITWVYRETHQLNVSRET